MADIPTARESVSGERVHWILPVTYFLIVGFLLITKSTISAENHGFRENLKTPPDIAPTWGQVLIAGGGGLAATEIYDPDTNSFAPAADTATMNVLRNAATATLLSNGMVLIAGGGSNTTDIYNPGSNSFLPVTNTPAMNESRYEATATLLPSGSVLIAGGAEDTSTELYDPVSNAFAASGVTAAMNQIRFAATATLLPSGKVLIAGGYDNSDETLSSTELFDPLTNEFMSPANTASMNVARAYATATRLSTGQVLIAGGCSVIPTSNGGNGCSSDLSSTELYDPSSNTFAAPSQTASMNSARAFATATLLESGNVLIAGSGGSTGLVASTDLYDPMTNSFTVGANTASMNVARDLASATRLPSGKVMIAGGVGVGGTVLSSTELYDPVNNSFAPQSQTAKTNNATYAAAAVLLPPSMPTPLYVGQINGPIGEYNSSTGIGINPNLIASVTYPYGIAISGNTLYVANYGNGTTVSTFDVTNGASINPSFISGLYNPEGLAISGNTIYVSSGVGSGNSITGTIVGTYDATTGAPLNPNLITGRNTAESFGLAVSGNTLFVSDGDGTVSTYDAITGEATDLNFITGLQGSGGLALSGNKLFVVNADTAASSVGEYDAGTGAAINPNFITGLNGPIGIAVSGNDLFIANFGQGAGTGSVGEYDASSGAPVNSDLITGLGDAISIVVPATSQVSTITATGTPVASQTATPTSTVTAIAPTLTAVATATMTQTATTSATTTMTAVPTNVAATPTATASAVCPPSAHVTDIDLTALAAKPIKLPVVKPIRFGDQARGTTGTLGPIILKLPSNVMVTQVTSNNSDFIPTTTCIGQSLQCSISLSFHPSSTGARRGAMTIGNNIKPINVALSGTGVGPKVKSLDHRSDPPLAQLTLSGSGFQPGASALVNFAAKVKKAGRINFLVPGNINNTGTAVQVPPIYDPNTLEPIDSSAMIIIDEFLAPSGTPLSSKSPSLKIIPYDVQNSLPPGTAVISFLTAEQLEASTLATMVVNTPNSPLAALADSLNTIATSAASLLTIISGNPNADLGSINGMQVTESSLNLQKADSAILAMLNTMAGNSTTGGPIARVEGHAAVAGSGCLAAEAAQALADEGNPTAFSADIAKLFADALTSSACQQASAATATLGIVNGAGGVALALTSQASNVPAQPVLPIAAVLLADLAPAGQLLSVATSLAQTTPQARQQVQASVASFNTASQTQLQNVVNQSQGAVNNSYNSSNQTAQAFNAATPPPLDGTYAGTFSGTQFVSDACPSTLPPAPLSFAVQGSNITVIIPGAGSGTLDMTTGAATFAPTSGIGGANVSCTFAGTLLPNTFGPASGTGTWSCSSTGAGSSFNSANGTWSASKQ